MLAALVVLGAVLRLWMLGRTGFEFDEAFTAMAGRLPVHRLLSFLAHNDSHPPLDYLMRKPFADHAAGEFLFRLPSVILSIGSLALAAWWLRGRRTLGTIAVALLAVSGFQIRYGREARMYAAMILLGLVVAVFAERWLVHGGRRPAAAAGGALLVALFFHASGVPLALGMLTLPGLRRDADAWWWRGATLAALALWGVTWGPSLLRQAGGAHTGPLPVTPASVLAFFARLVGAPTWTGALVVALIAAGGLRLAQRDDRLARVFVACFVVPCALAILIGTTRPFLVDRTLAFASWAPLLAIAAAVESLTQRSRALMVGGALAAVMLVIPQTFTELGMPATGRSRMPVATLARVAGPGDAVAISPSWRGPLLDWYFAARRPGPERPLAVADADAFVLGPRPWSGRLWLVRNSTIAAPIDGMEPCEAPAPARTIRCFQRAG